MITFQNIQKVYEKDGQSLVALQDINLHINKGDIFGFIGYSGAGKSSLIRLVNQLENQPVGQLLLMAKILLNIPLQKLVHIKKALV